MIEQNTTEWLKLRESHIGGSDAPAIMGVSPWKTRYELWEEKTGLFTKNSDNYATRYGKEMEPIARAAYEKYTNIEVIPEVIFHPTRKYAMASLDGINIHRDIILEVKCCNEKDFELAKSGKVPEKYYPQLQHQLDVNQEGVVHYWAYRNGEGVLIEIEKDEEFREKLVSEEEAFWKSVTSFTPPDEDRKQLRPFLKDSKVEEAIARLEESYRLRKMLKERDEADETFLKQIANYESAEGYGLTFTRYLEKGRVNYKTIPELQGVDLEQYRGKPIEKWRKTFLNG